MICDYQNILSMLARDIENLHSFIVAHAKHINSSLSVPKCLPLLFSFSYVSRISPKNSTTHVTLGTQQLKPTEFGSQINLNMDNAWGILRCIIDTCLKLPEGKYLIMKDPNKVKTT